MRRTIFVLLALVGLILAATVAVALREARADPVVRHARIALPHWPAGAPPIRVALLSDIHLGSLAMDRARLTRIVAQVNALRPDLILIAGDFINGERAGAAARIAPGLGVLYRLRAPLGTVAVLGNHDYDTVPADIALHLRLAGVTVLDNGVAVRGPLVIGGVADAATAHDRLRPVLAAMAGQPGAPLILTHSPDLVPEVPATIPLVLTGHTHCGQVVLPLIGPLKIFWPPRYTCGIVRDPHRLTIVTAGLGTSELPVRLGAASDLWLLTLGPR